MPLLLLGWMSARLHNNERVVIEHQFQKLIESQLRESDQFILNYFTQLENTLLKTPNLFQSNINPTISNNSSIRQHISQSPYIDNIFILDQTGQRLFPPHLEKSSHKEQKFIKNTQDLWSDISAFRPNIPADISSERIKRLRAEQKDSTAFSVSGALSKLGRRSGQEKYQDLSKFTPETSIASTQNLEDKKANSNIHHGWTVWHSGTQTQTFFWFWNQQNQLVGLKLSTSHWISELINQLPDDRNAQSFLGDARIKLINEKQQTIYQWGNFEDELKGKTQAQGQRLLGHPLIGWRLAYFSSSNATNNNFQWVIYIALLFLIALLLIGLGIYTFREYRRDIRTAEQRVTFVNQVSHELKTPLTNICMYADLIDSQINDIKNVDEPKMRKYISVLTTESQRLGRLINNVLSFSRSQKQQQQLNLQRGSIDETLIKIIEVFKPAFSTKGIAFKLDLKANNPVMFDQNILEQIINNLLSNVEKYAHQGKLACICSSQKDGMTTISVTDDGTGIDKKIEKRLFEPFYRGNSALTEGISGTGIGLSIVNDLCYLHGGNIILDSKQKNNAIERTNGACFVITLKTPFEARSS